VPEIYEMVVRTVRRLAFVHTYEWYGGSGRFSTFCGVGGGKYSRAFQRPVAETKSVTSNLG